MFKLNRKVKAGICVMLSIAISAPFAYAYKLAEQANKVSGISLSSPDFIHNKNYDEIIEEAEQTKSEYEAKAAETQAKIDELSGEYDSILDYIQELDEKQNQLSAEVVQIQVTMANLNKEKEETELKLKEATAQRDEQYEKMQARIQYVYENGDTSYLDILFSSGNIADILNRVEYVSQISKYDDQLFANFAQSVKTVQEYNDMLDIQLDTIADVQKSYDLYYQLAEEILEAKNQALDECAEKLGVSRDLYEEYMVQIETQQMTIAEAQADAEKEREAARLAAEEAAKREQERLAGGDYTPNQNSYSSLDDVKKSDNTSLSSMSWPLPYSGVITSYFGYRDAPTAGASTYHRGVDIGVDYGTPILAALAGTVIAATYGSSEGNYVMIDHGDNLMTIYMHASSLAVTAGTYVQQGEVIAYVGSTGVSTGDHLHFGVIIDGDYCNPLNYVGG